MTDLAAAIRDAARVLRAEEAAQTARDSDTLIEQARTLLRDLFGEHLPVDGLQVHAIDAQTQTVVLGDGQTFLSVHPQYGVMLVRPDADLWRWVTGVAATTVLDLDAQMDA